MAYGEIVEVESIPYVHSKIQGPAQSKHSTNADLLVDEEIPHRTLNFKRD